MIIRNLVAHLSETSFTVYGVADDSGDCVLTEWLSTLNGELKACGDGLVAALENMARRGPPKNEEVCHKIRGDIWQIRKGQLRVLWFYDKGRVIVCTHGFIKKSRGTPKLQIDAAFRTLEQYHSAKAAGLLIIRGDND